MDKLKEAIFRKALEPIFNRDPKQWSAIEPAQTLKAFSFKFYQVSEWVRVKRGKQEIAKHVPQPMYQMVSAKASKMQLIERFGHLNLKQIVNSNYPTVGGLERMHGKYALKNSIAVILADLSSSFGGDLKKDEIMEIVAEVRSGLNRNITLEGLYVVCSEIKSSSIYGKLTVNKVLTAVKSHIKEQSNAHENNNYQQHLQSKTNAPRKKENPSHDPEFRKVLLKYMKGEVSNLKK